MTTIERRRYVRAPYVRARTYLDRKLRAYASKGEERQMTLRVPIRQGTLTKDVLVRYGFGSDPMHFDEPWTITWVPQEGGIYPSFSGSLCVRSDETYHTSVLELRGTYVPPLGMVGEVFDAALGRHIAEVTADAILAEVADGIERQYREEEAAKRAQATA